MFDKVSYYWFRRTPLITSIGLFYKNRKGKLLRVVWKWRISRGGVQVLESHTTLKNTRTHEGKWISYWIYIYLIIKKENRLFVKLLLRQSFGGKFGGKFGCIIKFFNDISTSGGRHLHQHILYSVENNKFFNTAIQIPPQQNHFFSHHIHLVSVLVTVLVTVD